MTYEELINKIYSDDGFAEDFTRNPSASLRAIGISLDEAQLNGLVDALSRDKEDRDPQLDWFLSQVRKREVGALDWFAPQIRISNT